MFVHVYYLCVFNLLRVPIKENFKKTIRPLGSCWDHSETYIDSKNTTGYPLPLNRFSVCPFPCGQKMHKMMSKENLLFKYFNFQVLLGCVDLPSSITQEIPQVSPTLQCLSPADRQQVLKCIEGEAHVYFTSKVLNLYHFLFVISMVISVLLLLLLLLLLFSITSYHLYPSTVQWFWLWVLVCGVRFGKTCFCCVIMSDCILCGCPWLRLHTSLMR